MRCVIEEVFYYINSNLVFWILNYHQWSTSATRPTLSNMEEKTLNYICKKINLLKPMGAYSQCLLWKFFLNIKLTCLTKLVCFTLARKVWDQVGSLTGVPVQNTLLSQCTSPPRSINSYMQIVMQPWMEC